MNIAVAGSSGDIAQRKYAQIKMGTDIIHPPNIPRKAERLCFTIWVSLPALSLGNSRLTSKPSRAHTTAAAVPDKNRSNQLIMSNFRLTDSKILEMIHNGSVTKMLTIAFPSSISREEIGAERIIQKFFPSRDIETHVVDTVRIIPQHTAHAKNKSNPLSLKTLTYA